MVRTLVSQAARRLREVLLNDEKTVVTQVGNSAEYNIKTCVEIIIFLTH